MTLDTVTDGDDFDVSHDSIPNSPASSTASQSQKTSSTLASTAMNNAAGTSNKRFRTQMSSLQVSWNS